MTKTKTLLSMLGLGLAGSLLAQSNVVSPSQIKGVKWRQYAPDEFLQTTVDWWLNKPAGKTKTDVINAIANSGANAVIIRVDREDRFNAPTATNWNNAMDDIVDAIVKAKTAQPNLGIYLWGRIWLERDGAANYTNVDGGATAVKNWFEPILDKAKAAGVLDRIHGISLIEINCDRIEDVKEYAKRICDKFNSETKWNNSSGVGFMKTRNFLMPGAGFGMDFRNVNNDNGTFLNVMGGRCKNFAFVYKYMKADHDTVTAPNYSNVLIGGVNRSWETDMEANNASFSVADRKTYLKFFGIDKLTGYLNSYKASYPTTCNIVFWGDKWDSISKTPPLSRQALHSLLVKNDGSTVVSTNKGYFFNLAASDTTNSAAQKFYLLNGSLTLSTTLGWSNLSVGTEWNNWPTTSPGY
jgi:hypothetical protein